MAKKKQPHRKADRATVRARIEEILSIRLDGAQFHDIVQYSAEKGWGGKPGVGLKERQLRLYMARVDVLLVERQERKRKLLMALHLARRESLYARAVNAADYRAALAILDSEAKLQALFANERDLREVLKMFAEQSKQLADLEKRNGHQGPTGSRPGERETARRA